MKRAVRSSSSSRMRRPCALRAEVAGRLDEAGAEVLLPDAIDDHAADSGAPSLTMARASSSRPLPCVNGFGESATAPPGNGAARSAQGSPDCRGSARRRPAPTPACIRAWSDAGRRPAREGSTSSTPRASGRSKFGVAFLSCSISAVNQRLAFDAGVLRLAGLDLLDLILQRLCTFVHRLLDRAASASGSSGTSAVLDAGEDAGQGVVVLRGDRIELVIVAASARHRQPEERAADSVWMRSSHSSATTPLITSLSSISSFQYDRAEAQETERGPIAPAPLPASGRPRVASARTDRKACPR